MSEDNSESKTILIVDDEPHIRALLEETLEEFEDEGVELLVAADGAQGLELALAHQPDLVFLDVMMPKMNGYDVCRAIKKDPNLKNVYVIMLTAKGQEADKEKGEDAGANEYLTKPFDPDEIVSKASEILGIKL